MPSFLSEEIKKLEELYTMLEEKPSCFSLRNCRYWKSELAKA